MRKLVLGGLLVLVGCSDRGADSNVPEDAATIDARDSDDAAQSSRADGSQPFDPDAGANDDDASSSADAAQLDVKVLREAALDSGVRYQLLELTMAPHAPAYAQWFPPPDGGTRPVVVMTKPYDGIDWTKQEVDERWAKQGQGLFLDVDSPGPDGGIIDAGTRSSIAYAPLPPDKVEDYFLYGTLHNFGTLLLYGRFYAGGDVQNDIDDMTLGFEWLARAPQVDKKRIGIFGGSWGGFEALYGAAYARDDVKPAAGVALSPLVDFEREVDFVTKELPGKYMQPASRQSSATFFEPYLRRMYATTTARGGYDGLRGQDLVSRIKAPFLLIHEDWDTLTAFDASKKLVESAPAVFKPLWLLHAAPPYPSWDTSIEGIFPVSVVNKHGLLMEQWGGVASYAFVTSFLLRHLGDADQQLTMPWPTQQMRQLLTHVHQLQRANVDVAFFAARLEELTDKRLVAVDPNNPAAPVPGAKAVAEAVNREWGTSFTEANVAEQLKKGLPEP